jgi:hypothetical protein
MIIKENIRRFDIAMDNAMFVGVLERGRDLLGDFGAFKCRHRA